MRIYIFLMLLFSFEALSQELYFKFHWSYLSIADLSIRENNYLALVKDKDYSQKEYLKLYPKEPVKITNIEVSTKGPLKLIRNYQSTISKRQYDNDIWDYYLIGMDRGNKEEKLITYSSLSYPVIKKFIDDEGVDPLIIDDIRDFQSIDPLSVLLNTMNSMKEKKKCSNKFFVFDGKRRYQVLVKELGDEKLEADRWWTFEGPTVHCQIKLIKESLEINNNEFMSSISFEANKWPFNGEERQIDVWFSTNDQYIPVKFKTSTPLGNIIGRIVIK